MTLSRSIMTAEPANLGTGFQPVKHGLKAHATQWPIARLAGLSKQLDERPVLNELTFDIAPGQFVALLGANGAGKSTLMKVLAMLTPPSDGTLELFGEPASRSAIALRRRIGLIGHQSMLYAELSARENLVLFAKLYGLPDPQKRAGEMLHRVSLADRGDDPVKSFSRGMTQRIAIARALLHEPQLLLADEPFAGLDAAASRSLETVLADLHRHGKTIVMAHHDIAQALRLAERAIVLREGYVMIDAPAGRLTVDDVLREVEQP